ncbi:MAG TPA: hypothetical protein VKD28_04740 [Gemmatimonadales bacterium]|nr:hypothetical protein [Gemmatimonadales bacterium]
MASQKQKMNLPLKLAIIATGQSQRDLAVRTGIGEVRLSAIVNGWKAATDAEEKILAKATGRRRRDLFPQRARGPKRPAPRRASKVSAVAARTA